MQFIFGSAKAPSSQPVMMESSFTFQDIATSNWKRDLAFGNADGSNRLFVIVYMSESRFDRVHSSPKYNGIAGTLIGQARVNKGGSGEFSGQALTISASYWLEADLPSSSGQFEFDMTLDGANAGHMARSYLWKDVDQTTPVGTLLFTTKIQQTPTYPMGNTATTKDQGVVLAVGQASQGPTFVSGDMSDSGSDMNDLVELAARNPALPGGAMTSSWDVVPANNTLYQWDCKAGIATIVQAAVSILVPINQG